MALADTIRNATGPVVKNLMGQLGSRIKVRRSTLTYAADNSEINAWATVAGGDEVACKLDIVAQGHVQRVWGVGVDISVEGMLPNGLVDIKPEDGVQVLSGFLAGQEFRVEQVRPDDLGSFTLLGLVEENREIV